MAMRGSRRCHVVIGSAKLTPPVAAGIVDTTVRFHQVLAWPNHVSVWYPVFDSAGAVERPIDRTCANLAGHRSRNHLTWSCSDAFNSQESFDSLGFGVAEGAL